MKKLKQLKINYNTKTKMEDIIRKCQKNETNLVKEEKNFKQRHNEVESNFNDLDAIH